MLVIAIEALRRLGVEGFTITLSHADFFNGIAERLELDEDARRSLQEVIDCKDSKRLEMFLEGHADKPSREVFCRLTALAGKHEVVEQARALAPNNKSVAALDDIDRVYRIAETLGIQSYIDIDLGDVGGLDYYTGLTFKIYAPGIGTALGRGGRYDRLLENFGLAEPAVGFSLCLDWLAQLLAPHLLEIAVKSDTAVRLKPAGDIARAFKEANRLRSEGKKIEIS